MPDFPVPGTAPLFITSFSQPGGYEVYRGGGALGLGLASGSWGTANLALYIPFALPWPYLVNRVFWGNGSTLTGNKDFGIYTADGTRIYSTGSTAESGASVLQYVTPTPFLLAPGRYYMAIVCSAAAGHSWGITNTTNLQRISGMLQQATALPLPATATFAAVTGTLHPLCGITRTASGF